MKLLSLLICLCFTMNVFAASNLESVFDDYQYALTVEWDQKDKNFMETETQKFYQNLKALNVTPAELLQFAESKIQETQALNELRMQASVAGSTEELIDLLSQNQPTLYRQGANWNGRTVLVGAAVVGVSALFIYSVYFAVAYGGCMETTGGMRKPCNQE